MRRISADLQAKSLANRAADSPNKGSADGPGKGASPRAEADKGKGKASGEATPDGKGKDRESPGEGHQKIQPWMQPTWALTSKVWQQRGGPSAESAKSKGSVDGVGQGTAAGKGKGSVNVLGTPGEDILEKRLPDPLALLKEASQSHHSRFCPMSCGTVAAQTTGCSGAGA